MFHLLVLEGSADQTQTTCTTDRFLTYTEDEVRDRFLSLTDSEFLEIPALFMGEGFEDEVARIGRLIKVSQVGREVRAYYHIDPNLPSLTNGQLYQLRDALQIADFEFSRNHWAIKKTDLFETLYKERIVSLVGPTVFSLSDKPVRKGLISVMMPFDAGSNSVYRKLKSTLEDAGYICRRADDMWENNHIMQDVIELICTAEVVVCDLSGKNPNVFYEAGIAHTLGRQVILITQSMEDVPFDLRSLRCVTYLNNGEGRDDLAGRVLDRVTDLTRY